MAKYLIIMELYYRCWNDNIDNINQKIVLLQLVLNYFTKWQKQPKFSSITTQLYKMIQTSILSLIKLQEFYQTKYLKALQKISIFGTNIVENFFSIIRQKVRYPNDWEYRTTYFRAKYELMKRFSNNYRYRYPNKVLSKNYNNQTGLNFDINTIDLQLKRKTTSTIVENNKGNKEDENICIQLATKYKCTRRRLTIRDATCKETPLHKKTTSGFKFILY